MDELAALKAKLAAKRISQVQLADALGIAQSGISRLLKGERQLKASEWQKIRELLGEADAIVDAIPVIGLVTAGRWREAVQRPVGAIPRPDPSIPRRAFGLDVDGDSMDLVVPDGGKVIVDPDDKALYPRRYYVVMVDGEATFKQFMADPARLVPCSSNPAHTELQIGEGLPFEVVGRVIWQAGRL